ncbi:type II secretion system pilot lipoprotein GspS [Serratia sp. L9]|uniref:type II secretion system pilot lipoprotein GspS n=1 Tax=Serratia sp. L9 TaxID=3423946 RepID=UPI003D67DA11
MKKYRVPLMLINAFLLTGCSQSTSGQGAFLAQPQQVEQLATLVASSDFLRDNCQRSDIPASRKLITAALSQAKSKGWVLSRQAEQQIPTRAQRILADLAQDGTPRTEKCAYFNQHLAPFIELARRQ